MIDRVFIKMEAKERLRAFWGSCIGMVALYYVLASVATGLSFGIGAIFLAPPLLIGYTLFFMRVWRGKQPGFDTLFNGFDRYSQSLVSILWMQLWTFLWSLLFVIPGIVKGLSYSMTPYLVAEHPTLNPRKALKLSTVITDGYKGSLLLLHLSFFGWWLLSGLTFGILAVVYVVPYWELTMVGAYETLLEDALKDGRIALEDLST